LHHQNESKKRKDPSKKLQIIIYVFVVPSLIISTVIIGLYGSENNEKSFEEILLSVNLECYNVNWFGLNPDARFQVVFKDSLYQIQLEMENLGLEFNGVEFLNEQRVKDFLAFHCPHIDNITEIQDGEYDSKIGIPAYEKCVQRTLDQIQCAQDFIN